MGIEVVSTICNRVSTGCKGNMKINVPETRGSARDIVYSVYRHLEDNGLIRQLQEAASDQKA